MSTGVDQDSLQYAQSIIQGFVTQNYIAIAILAVLVHDTVAYFEKEIKYFWAKPKSAVSILYFVNRYGAILAIAAYLPCRVTYMLNILNILFLRVRALFSQDRTITRALLSIFGLEALAGISIAIQGSILEDPSIFEFDGLSLCVQKTASTAEVVSSWCIPLGYGTLLMALALYKARQFWKESAGFKGLDLVKVLIRDQVLYFLAVNVVCIANILSDVVELNSFGVYVLIVIGNPGLMSIVGSRLLLNMKEAGEKGLNQGTSYSIKSVQSNIEFAAAADSVAESSIGNATERMEAEMEDSASRP